MKVSREIALFGLILNVLSLSACRFDEEVWCHDLRDLRREAGQRQARYSFEVLRVGKGSDRQPASATPFQPNPGVSIEERLEFERNDGQRWSEGVLKRLEEVRILSETHPKLRMSDAHLKNAAFVLTTYHGRISTAQKTEDLAKARLDLSKVDEEFARIESNNCPNQ